MLTKGKTIKGIMNASTECSRCFDMLQLTFFLSRDVCMYVRTVNISTYLFTVRITVRECIDYIQHASAMHVQ